MPLSGGYLLDTNILVHLVRNNDGWSEAHGRRMGKNDVCIAATARFTSTTVLTTDRDFDDLHDSHADRAWRVDREWVDLSSKLPL